MYLHSNQLASSMFKALTATIVFTCLFISSQASWTQTNNSSNQGKNIDDERRWYRVELIVFRQGGNPREQAEQWDTNIKLSYPLEWTTLVTALPDGLSETSGEDQAENTSASPNRSSSIMSVRENENSNLLSQASLHEPLLLLPESELTLSEEARKLQRSNNYRVLFHGAWDQGMLERNDGPAILIEGGESFGEHKELEGSIQLKLQRYLHITTNLWITDFATNFGQEELNWPEIPTPPNKPQKRLTTLLDDRSNNLWSQLETTDSQYDDLITSPYIIENIASIKVTRRMRSSELHYIDHPLAGILIQFTPIDSVDEDGVKDEIGDSEENIN